MRYLLILLLFVTAGCNDCPPKREQTLHLNLTDDPVSLDPRLVRSLKDLTVVKQLYEGLTRSGELAIARAVHISDDLLTYTFELRESFWSDGEPVTAYDFERSWKEVLDPAFASDYAYMLFPIKNAKSRRDEIGVHAVDAHTLVVELEMPTPYFLELTAFPTFFPFKCDGVSNGPFVVEKNRPGDTLELVKNPTYWDADRVRLAALAFSILDDNNTESQLFEKNRLDWLGQPTSHNLSTDLIGARRESVESYPVAGTFWFKFNTAKAPFDRPEIRRAFAYALNRSALIEHILQGGQAVATGPLPPSMQLSNGPHFADHNSAEAHKLLQETGWSGRIVLNYPPSERNTKIVQLVQQQWQETFGIEVVLEAVEQHLYRRKLKEGDYQVGTGDWIADFNDPIAFLELFTSESTINDTGWHNKRYDTLIEQSRVDKNRSKVLAEAEKILVEEMPVAPVYHYSFDYFKNSRVNGVELSPLGIADFKLVSLTP